MSEGDNKGHPTNAGARGAGGAGGAADQVTPQLLRDMLKQSSNTTEAMTAALAALPQLLANAMAQNGPAVAADGNPPPQPLPRELRDRRVPTFWEENPVPWFKVLDDHLALATNPLTQQAKFGLLLPLLTPAAVSQVTVLVQSPPQDVYDAAKAALLKHFGRDPLDMAAELCKLNSLGGRTARGFLEYMRSLQPGEAETTLFRYIFLRSLPPHASAIVSHHKVLNEMADAADVVLAAVPVCPSENTPTLAAPDTVEVAAVSQSSKPSNGLCWIHARYGKRAFNCAAPDSCKMKNVVRKKKQENSPAVGQ